MNGMGVGPPGDEKCPEMPYLGRVSVLGAEMGLFLLPLPPPPSPHFVLCYGRGMFDFTAMVYIARK